MSKHTPTPWKMNIDGNIILPDGQVIKLVHCTYANAEFIIRACNSQPDLLAALEQIQNHPVTCIGPSRQEITDNCDACSMSTIAKAAVTKAGGE